MAKDITGFLRSNKHVEVTPPVELGEPMRLPIFYPHDGNKAMVDSGQEKDCPLIQCSIRATLVVTPEGARRTVENGDGVFCWNVCELTDCPEYVKNRYSSSQ